jgi:hypothetical protein
LAARPGLVHVALDAGEAREVAVDVVARRLLLDAQALRQAERAHAVDQAEVDGLGIAALLGETLRRLGTLNTSPAVARCTSMPFGEGAQQASSPLMWAMMRSSICE